jgi:hypothetical protein
MITGESIPVQEISQYFDIHSRRELEMLFDGANVLGDDY